MAKRAGPGRLTLDGMHAAGLWVMGLFGFGGLPILAAAAF